jgi:hypothetical protein
VSGNERMEQYSIPAGMSRGVRWQFGFAESRRCAAGRILQVFETEENKPFIFNNQRGSCTVGEAR